MYKLVELHATQPRWLETGDTESERDSHEVNAHLNRYRISASETMMRRRRRTCAEYLASGLVEQRVWDGVLRVGRTSFEQASLSRRADQAVYTPYSATVVAGNPGPGYVMVARAAGEAEARKRCIRTGVDEEALEAELGKKRSQAGNPQAALLKVQRQSAGSAG